MLVLRITGALAAVGGNRLGIPILYRGTAAVLRGLGLLIACLAFAGWFGVQLLGQGPRVKQLFDGHPGPLMLVFAALALTWDAGFVIGPARPAPGPAISVALTSFFRRLGGVVLIIAGIIGVILGGLEVTSPDAFDALVHSAKAAVGALFRSLLAADARSVTRA